MKKILQPDRESFKLEALAERKLGLKGTEFADIVPKGSTFMDVPLETACSYAAEDADFTRQLWSFFKERLEESGLSSLFYELEGKNLRPEIIFFVLNTVILLIFHISLPSF